MAGQWSREKGKMIRKRIGEDVRRYRWVLPAVLLYDLIVTRCFGAFCPMVILTGLPCPGCGMTRAILCLFTGRLAEAWQYNPCVYLWLAAAVYVCRERYICGRPVKGIRWLAGGIAAVMICCYLYRMMTVFPGEPPMVMKEDSVLGRLLPFCQAFRERVAGGGRI